MPGPRTIGRPRERVLLVVACFAVYVLYGANYLAIRVTVRHDIPALLGSGVRYLLAGVVTLAFLQGGEGSIRLDRRLWGLVSFTGVLLLGTFGLVAKAEETISSSLAAILLAALPLWIIVLRVGVARERVPPAAIAGLVGGFAGVAIVVVASTGGVAGSATAVAVVVAVSIAQAVASFMVSRAPLPDMALLIAGWQMVVAGGVLVLGGVAAGDAAGLDLGRIPLSAAGAFAYLVLVGTVLTFTSLVWLLQRLPVSRVSIYAYSNPVVAVVLGWALAGESLLAGALLGGLLVVVCVAVAIATDRPASAAQTR